jgi:SNF2 family DNA or RNA helicase
MGLGKTVQTIAHILAEKQNGKVKNKPFLIVCPTSVVPNWLSELTKFAPSLNTLILHGTKRTEQFQKVKKSDVVLTSYALLAKDIAELKTYSWRGVVMDEAQYIKNPATKMSQSAYLLKADHRICLTGTPVENHLGELWSQFHFLNPGMLGSAKRFSDLFRVPIERQGNMERQKLLSSRIRPFMIRRTKVEVEKDLPPKTVILKPTELEGAQRDLYELIRVSMHQKVRDEIANKGLSRSQITILEALLKLRQACCDPRLVKIDKARSVTVSAKLEMLTEMLSELVSEGRKVLLFSQFTSMLDLIEPELSKLRIPFVQIRGDTTDRTTPVKRFQAGDVPVFLLSLKAGGTGLNLTAADTVIHYDPWWNPAVEDQATDRAYRIGQDKPVFVYKLIASGTIEERMLELQERKRKIASSIYDPETAGSLKFNENDLEFLFQPIGATPES